MRLPRPQDWSRFLHYSQRVRTLESLSFMSWTTRLHCQVLWTIAALKPTLVVFPNLLRLTWTRRSAVPDECIPPLLSLLTAHVRHITLSGMEYSLPSISSYVSDVFPNLHSLILTSASGVSPMPELSLEPTMARSLTKLDCGTLVLDSPSFNIVARLPRLQSLSCALPANSDDLCGEPELFPVLQHFTMTVAMLQHLTAFSRVVTLQRVHTMDLAVREVVEPALLVVAIRKLLLPSVLTKLNIVIAPITGDPGGLAVLSSHLRPLLDFKALNDFEMICHCHLRLDNQFCVGMAEAWPRMGKLSLRSTIVLPNDIHGLPNLQGLVPFAIHCPVLKFLDIQFDASWDERMTLSLPRRSAKPCLTYLFVRYCPISHPHHVSAYLACLFPQLNISTWGGGKIMAGNQAAWKKDWEEVKRYLPLFARIREDERRWAREAHQSGSC